MGRKVWIVLAIAVAMIAAGSLWRGGTLFRPLKPHVVSVDLDTPLVRTDFSDPLAWAKVRQLISRPNADGFVARVYLIDDRSWAGLQPTAVVLRLRPPRSDHGLVIIADGWTLHDPEHTLLCVDPLTLKSLRVIPSELWSIENNLSLANLDWPDFLEAADEDGVLRGFTDGARK
jgi:hypothetical protein